MRKKRKKLWLTVSFVIALLLVAWKTPSEAAAVQKAVKFLKDGKLDMLLYKSK
ncbi:hypothetical protein [Metabacillus iocasae]|uniref:Uncharacterized protein n=1 Tax=Priestia iocasae TaxID=2291674 RepID=A0ABS2QWE3_9BACI|nr:hypothetical protein [Metabacillus iocasae]MBM7703066.1 hypothetical protein [Metabacillus iocasae]